MTEPRILTAMAHPLRRRLLDVLTVYGPATVGALSERTGQAAGNVSHHMRILAEAGLVDEAPELARDRREHWWRVPDRPLTWSTGAGDRDAATEAVEMAATSLNLERQIEFVRRWLDHPPEDADIWAEGPFSTDSWLTVTPAELAAFAAEINEVITRWSGREIPEDGRQRHTVFTFARAVPAQP